MAQYVNTVEISGNATRDSETKYTPSGKAVTKFRIANGGNDKKGGGKYPTHYFNCVAFDSDQAQAIKKGAHVAILGRLSMSAWDDRETGKRREAVEIVANEIELAISVDQERTQPARASKPAMPVPDDSEIPF